MRRQLNERELELYKELLKKQYEQGAALRIAVLMHLKERVDGTATLVGLRTCVSDLINELLQ